MMLAIIRPDSWKLPLLVHVTGAMLLVAALVVVLALAAHGLRRGDDAAALSRVTFRALLLGVLPAYLVMRVGAEWIASEEAVGDPTWVGIGYGTSDGGLLLILIAIGLAWRSARRDGGTSRAVAVLSALLLVAYVVTVWAMTAKPT
jgi:heme A synthase